MFQLGKLHLLRSPDLANIHKRLHHVHLGCAERIKILKHDANALPVAAKKKIPSHGAAHHSCDTAGKESFYSGNTWALADSVCWHSNLYHKYIKTLSLTLPPLHAQDDLEPLNSRGTAFSFWDSNENDNRHTQPATHGAAQPHRPWRLELGSCEPLVPPLFRVSTTLFYKAHMLRAGKGVKVTQGQVNIYG